LLPTAPAAHSPEGAALAAALAQFPENIEAPLFFHEGQHDGDSWVAILRLTDGYFAYMTAWCDFTGFDCMSGIKVFVDASLDSLLAYGVSEIDYGTYVRGTLPLDLEPKSVADADYEAGPEGEGEDEEGGAWLDDNDGSASDALGPAGAGSWSAKDEATPEPGDVTPEPEGLG